MFRQLEIMHYLKAVSEWNKKRREVNTAHVYAVPRKGSKEYDEVQAIMKIKNYPEKKAAVQKAMAAGAAIKAEQKQQNLDDVERLLKLLQEMQDQAPKEHYKIPKLLFDDVPSAPTPEAEPEVKKRTKRGEILAKNPEYKRFYATLTAPQRNALNTRRRDYIIRLKMTPEQAMQEAMIRHPSYEAFKEAEDAEL